MATPEHTPRGRGYETWLGYFQHANDYWRKTGGIQSVGEIDNCLDKFTDFFVQNETYCGGVRDAASLSNKCQNDPEADPACFEEHIFKERAIEVINSHDLTKEDEPLFLFYAFHLLHTPLEIPRAYLKRIDELVAAKGGKPIDSANRRLYAAMTLYMDETVGKLTEALKARGMWDDTLIIFTSDNGGPIYEPGSANNHPLKGGKYSDWEGGIRTNAFVSGGFVPSTLRGTEFHGVISIADWYATLCELAGVDPFDSRAAKANVWLEANGLPRLHPVESVAQWGFLLNGTNARPDALHISEKALIEYPFKLVTGKQVYSAWTGDLYPNCSTIERYEKDGPIFPDLKVFDVPISLARTKQQEAKISWSEDCARGCLFNVALDPTEHRNLAGDPSFSGVLRDLQQKLASLNYGPWPSQLFAPRRGNLSVEACEIAIQQAASGQSGFMGPFAHIEGYYTPPPPRTAAEALEDAARLRLLKSLNQRIVEEGVVRLAKTFVPDLRRLKKKFASDVCLHNFTELFVPQLFV
jgi:arylsulfatase I/J